MSDRRIGAMERVSAAHAARRRLRPTVDPAYHNALALRLADAAGLPLSLAAARVRALAAPSGFACCFKEKPRSARGSCHTLTSCTPFGSRNRD